MKRVVLLSLLTGTSCAFVQRSSWADVTSDFTDGRQRIGVGERHHLWVSYPSAGEDVAPPKLSVRCVGAPCEVGEASVRINPGASDHMDFDVIPTAPGPLTLEVSFAEARRSPQWTFGPFQVLRADRLTTRCRLIRNAVQLPCEGPVRRDDQVRVEVGAYSGTERFLPNNLELTPPPGWNCQISSASDDGSGPIMACTTHRPSPGDWLRARLGEVSTELKLDVVP